MTDHAFSIAGEESEHISILQCANCGLRINEAEYENYELLFGIKLPECKPKDEKQTPIIIVHVVKDDDGDIHGMRRKLGSAKDLVNELFGDDEEGYHWEKSEYRDIREIWEYKHPNPHYGDCPFRIEIWEVKE